MVYKILRLFFPAFFLMTTACTPTTDTSFQSNESQTPSAISSPDNAIFFPRQKKTNGERAVMEALTNGALALKENCIYLERGESLANYLLIWPPDFYFSNENGSIQIVDGEGKIVASIGDSVEMSGGEIHSLSLLDKSIQEQVPPQCPGPYWIIGEDFLSVNP